MRDRWCPVVRIRSLVVGDSSNEEFGPLESAGAEFLTDFVDTLRHATTDANAVLASIAAAKHSEKLSFEFAISPLGTSAVVFMKVKDLHVAPEWSHRLGDILTNYRSALDSFAFALATIFAPSGTLSEKQASLVYFPLADTEAKWRDLLKHDLKRQGWLSSLPPWLLLRIRAAQPFLLPNPDEGVLSWLHEIDRKRKHRWKLRLRPVLDPQMPHIFRATGRDGTQFLIRPDEQEKLNVEEPLVDGLEVFRLQTSHALASLTGTNGPHVAWLLSRDDSAVVDLQDFLIAISSKLQQLVANVIGSSSTEAGQRVPQLLKPPGLEGRWDDRLDDTGTTVHLTVRPARDEPTTQISITARNGDNLLTVLDDSVSRWSTEHGQPLSVSGYPGPVSFASFYYPREDHFPEDGTIRMVFPVEATFGDLRSVFGEDLQHDPPLVEVEINHGRGGGGALALFYDSLQLMLSLVEAYGVYTAGRQLVEWISRKVLNAPRDAVREWAASGELPTSITDYLRKNKEWAILDVERLFELGTLDAAELLRQSGFYSAESTGHYWLRADLIAPTDPRDD